MIRHQDTAILMFVKYPESGQVKLRLSADLNEEMVPELYRCFVQDTLATVKKIDACLFVCFLPVDAQKKFQKWLGSTVFFLPQNGADLGERMKNCFSYVFKKGFRRVILIGSDSPDIPETFLHTAFTELQTHDVVLGPSSDGGYYLIGFQNTMFTSSVFEDIHWSTSTVFQETLAKIKAANCSVSVLSVWSDVDTITDLNNLISRSKNTAFKSSHTITYLQQHHIQLEMNNETKPKPEQGHLVSPR
jgi:rSAM/selenodomain-associated transferase 1